MSEHDPGHTSFTDQLLATWPRKRWEGSIVLVAYSGGPDSTALISSLAELQPNRQRLVAAHFNHGLRDSASAGDQAFAEQVCRDLKIQCVVGNADQAEFKRERRGEGWESAARQLRYQFLLETAEQSGARYIVTGHTRDDQVETVLHNIIRGTGLAGLAGIPRVRCLNEAVSLVRPLLNHSRQQVLDYLQESDLPHRLDETNLEERFTRNRIRHKLLPWLESEFNSDVRAALVRLSQIAAESQASLREIAEGVLDRAIGQCDENKVILELEPLRELSIHLRRECFVLLWQRQGWPLQSMHFHHWQQLAESTEPLSNTTLAPFPGDVQVAQTDTELRIQGPPHAN